MASHISDLIHDATLLRETHSHKTHQGGVYIYHTTLFLTIQCTGIHESFRNLTVDRLLTSKIVVEQS
jgi:hypothetical protein